MRWIIAAGLALGAALAGNAQEGGAKPVDEALLQLGSYRFEIGEINMSSMFRNRKSVYDPCGRGAKLFDRLQRDTRMHQAMSRLADLPKTEQTELVRGALEHHLAVYSAHQPEFLETWTAHFAYIDAARTNTFHGIPGERTTGKGDGDDLYHWSREAILRLVVIAAAFELTDLAGEVDTIVRSAVETRDRMLTEITSEVRRGYVWSGIYGSTLYDPTVLAIGLSLGHEAARNPENLLSPPQDYGDLLLDMGVRIPEHQRSRPPGHNVVYVGRWPNEDGRRPMWRHYIATDGAVTPRDRPPSYEPVIASFLFAECLSESCFAALLAACGFEAAAAQ